MIRHKRPEPVYVATVSKQRERFYSAGRSTDGWALGELVTNVEALQEGDVLIKVCHPCGAVENGAENLVRVTEVYHAPIVHWSFTYRYVWPDSLIPMDRDMGISQRSIDDGSYSLYRAIDKREYPGRLTAAELPAFLSMP